MQKIPCKLPQNGAHLKSSKHLICGFVPFDTIRTSPPAISADCASLRAQWLVGNIPSVKQICRGAPEFDATPPALLDGFASNRGLATGTSIIWS